MKLLFKLYTLFTFFTFQSTAQKLPSVQILQDSIASSFRGLSIPSDSVIWVSGSNGTVGRSLDAGNTWKWMVVPGFEKKDFRDIEAFDAETAIIMAVDNPAYILKTKDGGISWKIVFEKNQEGMFLDAMDFKGESGVCIGDPINMSNELKGNKVINHIYPFILETRNSGDTWQEYNPINLLSKNEAIFAGSGSNIILLGEFSRQFAFITGGLESFLHFSKLSSVSQINKKKIPLLGAKTAGAFSVYSEGNKRFAVTGGDYNEYWKDSHNVVYTTNAGKTWKRSSVHGYRSCIIQADKKTFITCGTNGVDISFDGCKSWKLIHGDGAKGKDGFNVCAKSKTGKAVYFAGSGRIGKLVS